MHPDPRHRTGARKHKKIVASANVLLVRPVHSIRMGHKQAKDVRKGWFQRMGHVNLATILFKLLLRQRARAKQ